MANIYFSKVYNESEHILYDRDKYKPIFDQYSTYAETR